MPKKHTRGLSHFLVRLILAYTPLLAGSVLLAVVSGGREVDQTIALSALGVEAQVFAMFAALTPIFFVFTQFYRRGKQLLRDLATTVVSIIMISLFGIFLSIFTMVTQFFFLFVILFLFLVVVQVALLMSLFLLSFAGFKPIQNWLASD